MIVASILAVLQGNDPWIVFEGKEGPGKGKSIVLVSGDEEYRSEEALPALAKILSKHHGFTCTVLFAINKKTGEVDPNTNDNIPGLGSLGKADLMIIFTRFRNLPDDQMKPIDDYLAAGKPVVGLRTATHAFNFKGDSAYKKYTWNNKAEDYKDGFGRQVLGETWVSHHGAHGKESTRGVVAEGAKDHPILRGVQDVWGPTDVYGVRSLPEDSRPILMGQVLKGMKPADEPTEKKLMPLAWIREKPRRVFATTMGASQDLQSEGFRRLLVNSCFWAVGLEEKIPAKSKVDLVGAFSPRPFGFNGFEKGKFPADYAKD